MTAILAGTPALAATYASEFNTPFKSIDEFAALRDGVIAACEERDRDPSTMTFSAAVVVAIGADAADLERRAAAIGRSVEDLRANGVAGTFDEAAATMQRWHDAGAERLYLQVLDLNDVDHLDAIAECVTAGNVPI